MSACSGRDLDGSVHRVVVPLALRLVTKSGRAFAPLDMERNTLLPLLRRPTAGEVPQSPAKWSSAGHCARVKTTPSALGPLASQATMPEHPCFREPSQSRSPAGSPLPCPTRPQEVRPSRSVTRHFIRKRPAPAPPRRASRYRRGPTWPGYRKGAAHDNNTQSFGQTAPCGGHVSDDADIPHPHDAATTMAAIRCNSGQGDDNGN